MKNAAAQLQLFVAKVDRRYLQIAMLMLAFGLKIACGPVDGGGGPF